MHSTSKLSIIAAAASLLAALSAFGAASDPSGLTLVDLTSPDGNITSSNPKDANSNNTGPETAFSDDGNRFLIYSKDIYKDGGTVDIVYEFTEATVVTAYGIYNHKDSNPDARAPNTWTFSGSNDGSTWTELDAQNDETGWTASEFRFYYFGNKGSFTHYKIEITAGNGNDYTQFGTMEFYNVNLADAVPIAFGVPSVSSGSTSCSVAQPYTLREGATVTAVSLLVGESADSLSVSTVVPEFSDGVASFGLENLSSHATYFWQLKFAITYYEASNDWTSPIGDVKTKTFVTVVPSGTRTYTNPEHWSAGFVPDGYEVDIRIDGDTSVATTLSFASGEGKLVATNGVVNVDSGDTLSISTSYNNTGANMSLWTSCITNNGTITFGNVKKNNGDYYIHAYDSARDENYPSRNGRDGVININSMNAAGCDHYLYWLLDGSVNDGEITISAVGAQYQYAGLSLEAGGTFTNNGTIRVKTTGSYYKEGKDNKPGASILGLYGGHVLLTGTGKVILDETERAEISTQHSWVKSGGITYNLINDVDHTIEGEGFIDNCRLINKGLIRSVGTTANLNIRIPDHRTTTTACATNDVTGRIVADSSKGIYINGVNSVAGSRPNWNTRFVNLGLMEARTDSVIAFANGVNSTSGRTGDGDLSPTSGDYLKLWGRIAGGGRFQTIRPIHIMDGARLMPGDLANDDGTGDSTCGTLTFMSNVVMRANCTNEFQFAKADKFDSLHVGGTLKIDGTLKIVGRPHGGTFRMITSDYPIEYADEKTFFAAIDLSAAEGGSKPRLKSGSVTVETGETDPDTGDPITETVQKTIYYIEASFGDGFYVKIR